MSVTADAIPDRMRAVVLHAPGDWSMETVETPELTEVEDVICKVRAAAICGSDPKMMEGKLDWPPRHPFVPGHEWAGEVVAVGDDVDRFAPGDRIFAESHSGCGFCEMCRKGRYQLCENFGDFEAGHRQVGHTLEGAFAEYVAVPSDLLYHLDDAVSYPEGALLDTNAIALHCAARGNVDAGDTVAVLGTGIIGLCMVQHARVFGAGTVIATGNPTNNETAAELGADHVIPYDADVTGRIDELTDGQGVDVALEAVGVEDTMRQAIEVTRKGGTVAADGMPADPDHSIPTREIVRKELDFRGARAHANRATDSAALVANGQVDVASLVSEEFPLAAFETAYETFTEDDGKIRVVLRNE